MAYIKEYWQNKNKERQLLVNIQKKYKTNMVVVFKLQFWVQKFMIQIHLLIGILKRISKIKIPRLL